jgi:hypothetical protein
MTTNMTMVGELRRTIPLTTAVVTTDPTARGRCRRIGSARMSIEAAGALRPRRPIRHTSVILPTVGARILVVEDDPKIAAMLSKGLRARGFEVETVATGLEAVTRVEAGGVDVQPSTSGSPTSTGSMCYARNATVATRCR